MTCCFGQEEIKHCRKTHNNIGKLQIAGHLQIPIVTEIIKYHPCPVYLNFFIQKVLPHLILKRFLTWALILYQLASPCYLSHTKGAKVQKYNRAK